MPVLRLSLQRSELLDDGFHGEFTENGKFKREPNNHLDRRTTY